MVLSRAQIQLVVCRMFEPFFHDVLLKSGLAHTREHHYLNLVAALEVLEANRSLRPFGGRVSSNRSASARLLDVGGQPALRPAAAGRRETHAPLPGGRARP